MMTTCPSDLDLTKVKETWKRQLHESHLVEASKSQQINISSPYQYWFNDAPKRRPAHSPFFRKTEAAEAQCRAFSQLRTDRRPEIERVLHSVPMGLVDPRDNKKVLSSLSYASDLRPVALTFRMPCGSLLLAQLGARANPRTLFLRLRPHEPLATKLALKKLLGKVLGVNHVTLHWVLVFTTENFFP